MKQFLIIAFTVVVGGQLLASPLDGQAGRSVVSRAQSPEGVIRPKKTAVVAPTPEVAKPSAKDAIKIGVIEKLVLVGHEEFIASEKVEELLAASLCDGSEKTVGDLKAAIAAAKNELMKRGYYLIYLFPSRADAYDEAAKTLELAVEPGRFGDVKITMKNNDGLGDWYCEDNIAKRFKFVKTGEPFNYKTFRQALRLVNGHPDLMADTKIKVVESDVEEVEEEIEEEVEEPVEAAPAAEEPKAAEPTLFAMIAEENGIEGEMVLVEKDGESAAPATRKVKKIRKVKVVRKIKDGADAKTTAPLVKIRQIEAEIEVEDSAPFHATIELNNYAMDELDDWQIITTLQSLNLTGVEDILSVSPGVTLNGEMWSVAASYMRPFDWFLGGSWSVYGGYSDMNCDEIVDRMDLEGIGGFAGLNTSWNLYDTEKRNVALNVGIMWRLIRDQWWAQGTHLSQRNLNIVPITFGLSYGDKSRDWLGGLDFLSLSETINLDGDKAAFRHYSEDADADYTILRASWSRLQPFYGPEEDGEEWRCWSVFQKLELQCSQDNSLISPERLAFGGYNCLRGYRNRGYLGDTGVYGTTEIRTPVFLNPVTSFLWPEFESVVERIQLALFTDYGWLEFNDVTTPGQDQEEFLWSVGFGVRAALTKYLSLNFDFAVPLRRGYAHSEDENLELYFSIKYQY